MFKLQKGKANDNILLAFPLLLSRPMPELDDFSYISQLAEGAIKPL